MGTVNIAAFFVEDIPNIQVASAPELQSENVTSSASSAQSSAMPRNTEVVRIATDTTIRVSLGENPTATATGIRILANTSEYFAVKEGYKVAVIDE